MHKKLLPFTVAGCNQRLLLKSSELSANPRFKLRMFLVFCTSCYYFSLRVTYSSGLSSATVEARVKNGKQRHGVQSRTVLLLSVDFVCFKLVGYKRKVSHGCRVYNCLLTKNVSRYVPNF